MFHKMLPAKRTFSSAAEICSHVDFKAYDLNLSNLNSSTISSFCDQNSSLSSSTPPYKRARPNGTLPSQPAESWGWNCGSRKSTIDAHQNHSTAATKSSVYTPLAYVDKNVDRYDREQAARRIPDVCISWTGEKMPRKRQLLSSNPGRNELLDISGPDTFDSKNLPRRRPTAVPGELPPFLVSTGRETTSSRGSENTFTLRNPSNLLAASTPNVSPSQATNHFLESGNDYTSTSSGSWQMTTPMPPFGIPENTEGSLAFPTSQNARSVDLGSLMNNNELILPDTSDWGFIGPQPSWFSQNSFPTSIQSSNPFGNSDSTHLNSHDTMDILTPSSFSYNTPPTNSDLLHFHAPSVFPVQTAESYTDTSISPLEQENSPSETLEYCKFFPI